MIARHLIIHGRVQGVWFRDWTVKTAHELGLVGWVRNRRDGTVEAVVQGEEKAVERFLSLAKNGPPAAEVLRIDPGTAETDRLVGFEKRSTC
ncbi:acylphosphatase [Parasphingopyxis algicola]|uniref:acylphosphatase n=1 Tax=Parasphingopyxis algicola TaxID=2026624 RepID=UPI0015A28227|nr:acylphosphatase [Parasphingopyxis algicola]QLC24185.1 acylphosphatase [Parasphingopyxis algicola]